MAQPRGERLEPRVVEQVLPAGLAGVAGQVVPAPAFDLAGWPVALGLCLAFLVGNLALQYGAARLAASTTALVMLTELLFASVSSAWLGAADFSQRTFIGGSLIVLAALLAALAGADGAVPALPVADTLKRGGEVVTETVPRDGLWRAQTPQAFRTAALRAAHAQWTGNAATDDAQMVRAAGFQVAVVEGHPMLEKITRPADFDEAERRLRAA